MIAPLRTSRSYRTSPTARSLPPALLDVGRPRGFAAGDTIIEEGAIVPSCFVVLEGRVKMCRLTAEGRSLTLSLLGPGDLFGVAGAFGGEPACNAIVALEPARCLELRRRDVIGVLQRDPTLLDAVLPLLTGRLRECSSCLVEASCSRVETRFANLFLRLADRLGEPHEDGELIPLALARQELADMTGTTLETAIRVMSRWGKEGIVATRSDGFLLADRDAVEALSWG